MRLPANKRPDHMTTVQLPSRDEINKRENTAHPGSEPHRMHNQDKALRRRLHQVGDVLQYYRQRDLLKPDLSKPRHELRIFTLRHHKAEPQPNHPHDHRNEDPRQRPSHPQIEQSIPVHRRLSLGDHGPQGPAHPRRGGYEVGQAGRDPSTHRHVLVAQLMQAEDGCYREREHQRVDEHGGTLHKLLREHRVAAPDVAVEENRCQGGGEEHQVQPAFLCLKLIPVKDGYMAAVYDPSDLRKIADGPQLVRERLEGWLQETLPEPCAPRLNYKSGRRTLSVGFHYLKATSNRIDVPGIHPLDDGLLGAHPRRLAQGPLKPISEPRMRSL